MKEFYISQINNVEDLLSGDYAVELGKIQENIVRDFLRGVLSEQEYYELTNYNLKTFGALKNFYKDI